MARLAISEVTTFRWSFEEDVERYRAAGIRAIGVWRQKLADIGAEKGAALLRKAGLAVSSLQWAGGFTGSDGRTHEESLHDARQAIDALDDHQIRQIILLASEDLLFRVRLRQNPEGAAQERGFALSPGGYMALHQLDLDGLAASSWDQRPILYH